MGCGDDDGSSSSSPEGVKARGDPVRGGVPELVGGDVGVRGVLGDVAAGHAGGRQLEGRSHGDTFAISGKVFSWQDAQRLNFVKRFCDVTQKWETEIYLEKFSVGKMPKD